MPTKFWITANKEADYRLGTLPGVQSENVLVATQDKPNDYIYPDPKKILTVDNLEDFLKFIEAAELAGGRPITITSTSDSKVKPDLPTIHLDFTY